MAYPHIIGHPSAAGRAQDRESSPARDRRSTTVPRHQPLYCIHFTLFVTYLLPILPADCCICIVPALIVYILPIALYNSCIYSASMITYLLYPSTIYPACICLVLCILHIIYHCICSLHIGASTLYLPLIIVSILLTYWPIDCSAPYPIIPFSYLPIFSPDLLLLCTKCYRLPLITLSPHRHPVSAV